MYITLLGTLAASVLGNMPAGKPKIPERGVIRASDGVNIMSPHPLSNFEIQKVYKSKPKFNGIYWKRNYLKYRIGYI